MFPKRTAPGRWPAVAATVLMLATLSGIVVFWAMQLLAPRVAIAPAGSLVDASAGMDTARAGALFGLADGSGPIAVAELPSNIKVIGVAASRSRSAAVIIVDNRPAAAFGVGQRVDDAIVVDSVSPQEVVLRRNGGLIRVPAPPSADLAVLTSNASADPDARAAATASPVATRTSAPRPAPAPSLLPPLPPAGAEAAAAAPANTYGTPDPQPPAAITMPRRSGATSDANPSPNAPRVEPFERRVVPPGPSAMAAPGSPTTR